MRHLNKKDFDFFGVLIGVIVGLVLGYLIGAKFNLEPSVDPNDGQVMEEVNYVYTLQLGKYSNPTTAENYYNSLIEKNIECVYVCDGDYYYIYCAISTNEEEINNKKEAFALIGYDGIIKKEYLYNRANNVIENNNSYDFYIQMIDNLLNSLNNQAIEISDEFLINPVDIELLTWINMLSSIQNSDYKGKIQLQTYKMIIEKLK